MFKVPQIIAALSLIAMLSACTSAGPSTSWSAGSSDTGVSSVAAMGPSGPIGP